jgi:hypothetical protein
MTHDSPHIFKYLDIAAQAMVYVNAAKKTGAFLILSMVLSLAVLTFFMNDLATPTGRAVSEVQTPGPSLSSWFLFFLGILVGALMVGTYIFFLHHEAKRAE